MYKGKINLSFFYDKIDVEVDHDLFFLSKFRVINNEWFLFMRFAPTISNNQIKRPIALQ
jgi:hypothetical protein